MADDPRWQQADELLETLLDLTDEQRRERLAQCNDPQLRARVERLLSHCDAKDSFLETGEPMHRSWSDVGEPTALSQQHRGVELPSFKVGDVLSERYTLQEELGRGGMGVVYRAHDDVLTRDVAIKFVTSASSDPEWHDRLLREARSAASLNHRNIVAIHDVSEEAKHPFLVMELIAGQTLETAPPESFEQIVEVATQLCDALEHAHLRGVVHRDLKPANVLLAQESGGAVPKVVDLGVALVRADARITADGRIIGTPSYMAPEQAAATEVDGRADLYALGVMLYRWLTGKLPFTGDDALTVVSQHIHAPLVPPRSVRADVPLALDAIVVRLLAKKPERRFDDAAALRQALSEADLDKVCERSALSSIDGLVRGRMVGRDAQLERIKELWGESLAPPVALVSGEAGSGKSRLAREIVAHARYSGGTVLTGGCYEYEASTPYLPFVEGLRSWVGRVESDEDLAHLLGDSACELSRLAPEIGSRLGPFQVAEASSGSEARLRLFDHVCRVIRALAQQRGVLIVLDDVQWVDQATLGLLHYLTRQLRGDRVLFLALYRDGEVAETDPLAHALVDWNRERLATRVQLDRLDAEATCRMVATLLDDENVPRSLAEAIYEETEGNPFFVEEIVKAMIEEGRLDQRERGWLVQSSGEWRMPDGIRATVGQRLARVDETSLGYLRTASLLGKRFAFDELLAAVDASEDALLDALEGAERLQVIASAESESYAFTHDKIREYLIVEQNPIRRRRLHARIARALAERRENGQQVDVENLAHHFIGAGDHENGLLYAVEAAQAAAALYAYEASEQMYERARESAVALKLTTEIRRIDLALVEVLALHGRARAAAERLELLLPEAGSDEERNRLRSRIAVEYCSVGDERGRDIAVEALSGIDPEKQPLEAANAKSTHARYMHYAGELCASVRLQSEALELAEKAGDGMAILKILSYISGAYQHLARFDESNEFAERCVGMGRKDPSLVAGALVGYEFLAENAMALGDWREACRYSDEERRQAESVGATTRAAWAQWVFAIACRGLGRIPAAIEQCRQNVQETERLDESRLNLFARMWRAMLQADVGEPSQAIRVLQEIKQLCDARELNYHSAEVRYLLATAHALAGEWGAIAPLSREFDALIERGEEAWAPIAGAPIFALGLFVAGEQAVAGAKIETAITQSQAIKSVHYEALGLRARSELQRCTGNPEAALADLDRAITLLTKSESRLELARTRRLRGALLDEQGRPAARSEHAAADKVFDRCRLPHDSVYRVPSLTE